jgi:translation initiation factor IF-2
MIAAPVFFPEMGLLMAKEKVYKLAQEFKVSSEALVQMLRGMGIPVKSHMSTVDDNLRDEIKRRFEQERAEIKKEYDRKRQMMAKKLEELAVKPEKEPPAPAPAPINEAKNATEQASAKAAAAAPAAPAPAAASSPSRRPELHHAHAAPQAGERPVPSFRQHAHAARTFDQPAYVAPVPAGGQPAISVDRGDGKRRKKKGGRKRFERPEVSEVELKSTIKRTLAKIGAGSAKKKYRKEVDKKEDGVTDEKKVLKVSEFLTPADLANMIGLPISEVIAKCLELGLFVTINQRLDFETIELLSDEFGYSAQLMEEYAPEIEEAPEEDKAGTLESRAPVVTVMGHVDHGKTSLLDYIRKTNVIAGEAGGITQHIAAYRVNTPQGPVTFLDTPGHEAFTAMRARGSQITDVIVLVVAADSGVMPQTKEAIDHARAANVPLVVAINKVDLPVANPDKVKAELAQYSVLVEEYGGQVSSVEISAKTGKNIDKLLQTLALETEMLELKANPSGNASGVVIEAELDKGRGPIATVLIQKGTLRKGDAFVTGIHNGRVRDLIDERGNSLEEARPSQPVIVLGLSGTPQAGDSFKVVEDEKEAREISGRRRLAQKERELRKIGAVSLDHLYEQIKAGSVQSLNLVIKGDVDGSVEALAESLGKLSNDEIKVNVIHKSVGAIKEADIMLAAASAALVIGFHLSPNSKIRELAKREGVDIRTYRIIYEAVDEVKKAMEGLLAPEIKENVVANIEVRQVFRISRIGIVAGCMVTSGTVTRGLKARIIRDDVEVADTSISSLRRLKDDVREVQQGFECGLTLANFSDYKEGDRIEAYEEIKIARKLA